MTHSLGHQPQYVLRIKLSLLVKLYLLQPHLIPMPQTVSIELKSTPWNPDPLESFWRLKQSTR